MSSTVGRPIVIIGSCIENPVRRRTAYPALDYAGTICVGGSDSSTDIIVSYRRYALVELNEENGSSASGHTNHHNGLGI